ncbi:MAG: hypothetical protein ABFC28_05595 [Rikenellaceae bacterium]
MSLVLSKFVSEREPVVWKEMILKRADKITWSKINAPFLYYFNRLEEAGI